MVERGKRTAVFAKASGEIFFCFSKTFKFSNESTVFDLEEVFVTPVIANSHGAIMIYFEFFRSDPLPTRDFCRNMAKK